MNSKQVYVKDAEGKELEGEILFTFELNGSDFVFYKIEEQVFAAQVNQDGDLKAIPDDEWKLVEQIFNQYMKEQNAD